MFKKILIIGFLMMIVGCVSIKHVPISQQTAVTLSGKVLQNSLYKKPDFAAYTFVKAGLGLIGALAIISEGNDIIEKNSVEDPANYISEQLGLTLSEKYGVSILHVEPVISVSDDLNELLKTYSQTNLLLDVRTFLWAFWYFPTDWNNYRIQYTARLRLIDTQKREIIAEEFCRYLPEYNNTEDAPSYNELVDNNATGLKSELRKAADYCIEFFKKEAFRI
jgi:hypothetical protein